MNILNGLGGTLLATTAMRGALGAFFAISGWHKLTNKDRHATFVETLETCGVPNIPVMQWFVPSVEFLAGLGVMWGFLTPLSALGLLAICAVACCTSGRARVEDYKPIDALDRLDDWLYLPEFWYGMMLSYFIAAGAGYWSLDTLILKFFG